MSASAPKAIFLSYARDDASAARRVAEALRSAGLEVWFDENELRGGDTWDAKIRTQINDCALFVPIISEHTETRTKGYFRLEWKLAVDQTHLLADGVPFVAPVVIDATRENGASVPAEFLRVQWMRLPGALPTPQFVEQLKRLLDAPQKPASTNATRSAFAASHAAMPLPRGVRWWPWAIAGVAIAAGIILFATRPAAKTPSASVMPANAIATPAASAAVTGPASEARQLIAKARALYEPWDLATPGDFTLAEQLLKKALALDPTDGEGWAHYALLSCGAAIMMDSSESLKIAARAYAEKAMRLAPESGVARFAWAFSLRFDPQMANEAVRLLREEVARQPTNRFVVRTLGAALRSTGQLEQSLVYFDKSDALPGNDPITHYNRGLSLQMMKRFGEAEAEFDEAVAAAPHYAYAHWAKLNLILDVRQDLPRAQDYLARIPADVIPNEATALNAYWMAIYLKDPGKALSVVRSANDFIIGTGPKATLTALAHRMAGNEEAAGSDFKAALRLVETRLMAEPNDTLLLANKVEVLALQGERAAAEPLLREIKQRMTTGDRSLSEASFAYLLMLSHQPEAALAALESYYGKTKQGQYRSKVDLRYHPIWDPLRDNVRFAALLKTF